MSEDEEQAKVHVGKPYLVKFVGGDQHGQQKRLRYPMPATHEVARPPTYLGDGHYSASVSSLGYQRYDLRWYKDEPYYVWSEWLGNWDESPETMLSQDYESDNNRKIRIETEQNEMKQMQQAMAQADFETYGIAFLVDGMRVNPKKVKMMVRTKNPLTLELKDILDPTIRTNLLY